MSKAGTLQPDPTAIGNVAAPPFARLPDPETLYAARAERFRTLADGHQLGDYLRFLGDLSDCQSRLQDGLPEPDMPQAEALERAREHAMPPLDRSRFTTDAACDATLDRLFSLAAALQMPANAADALTRVRNADAAARDEMVRNVLAESVPIEAFAEHVFVAAAMQVHFARLASRLDVATLKPISDGTCPACGAAPVASEVVGWAGAHGVRFCVCSLCSTRWHVVRIKCVLCESTRGVSYQELEGATPDVKAETCENCRGYVKIMHQHKNVAIDPVADDVATLGLDILLREGGYRRGAVNPFLLGY